MSKQLRESVRRVWRAAPATGLLEAESPRVRRLGVVRWVGLGAVLGALATLPAVHIERARMARVMAAADASAMAALVTTAARCQVHGAGVQGPAVPIGYPQEGRRVK